MDQHLKQRPNHYRTLGLKPGARIEEIERAFARQMSSFMPRPFGSITAISIAYETLRDPARRRAYDQSIGIKPPSPLTRLAVPASGTMSFIGSRDTASRLADLKPASKPPMPQVEPAPIEPQAVAPPPAEPESPPQADVNRVSRFTAQSRLLSSRQPLPEPEAIPAPAAFTFEPDAVDGEASSLKPVVLSAVALVALAALLGAWGGLASIEDGGAEAAPELPVVKADLPPPRPTPAATAPGPPPVTTREPAMLRRPELRSPARTPRAVPAASEIPVSVPEPVTEQLAEAPLTQTTQAVPAVAARLPLADSTVARTIQRIGYPCGSVASTEDGGAAGVFVVTCTSGHSYRAAPVKGRYRFKRL
jgi:hypothetical protein